MDNSLKILIPRILDRIDVLMEQTGLWKGLFTSKNGRSKRVSVSKARDALQMIEGISQKWKTLIFERSGFYGVVAQACRWMLLLPFSWDYIS